MKRGLEVEFVEKHIGMLNQIISIWIIMIKIIDSSYMEYLDANNLYGWAMSQKLHVNDFNWVTNLSQLNESFIKNYDEIVI